MAETAKTPGFPQKYNTTPSQPEQELNPDAVVDLVTLHQEAAAARDARASSRPARAEAKPAKAPRKPRAKK